ncbi:glycerol kinase GlpK [Aureitalea marina]|uniref:Glycerol kinase n=1 Tax=Aureitalea marina TaxID=930804 RepID=A0A2S7KMS7_9FLAO|nr:glycerol kinase GlpK [Aureitalea marina]PQB03935.1 glycerol kinase [Aureitalea marina]
MQEQLVLAIDQGTTSSRTLIFNRKGDIVSQAQQDFEQLFPHEGWVEHDPLAIWDSQLKTMKQSISQLDLTSKRIAAIGITNQRETTLVWDRQTGKPVYNAIVWQDRRTAGYCNELRKAGHADMIQEKTGLILDAYFSATKLKWILDQQPGLRDRAKAGELCFGTVDTWLIWNLTGGTNFVTDTSNASRTMLFNIHQLNWDQELLDLFDIPVAILPEVRESSEVYGKTLADLFGEAIPIAGIAGDQQAALFGQLCWEKGMLKNTYGTGCFMLMNTGTEPVLSQNKLLTTVAWTIGGVTHYALEGSVFIAGAAVQWVRDGLKLIDHSPQIEDLARSVPDNGGMYFVPALTGLAAPYWDPYARGSVFGITRGSTLGHFARATLEGIAFQVYDIVQAMEGDAQTSGVEFRVDGGASANNLLMQFQADICQFPVVRPKVVETTAMGAAFLAGLAAGYWEDKGHLSQQWEVDTRFDPQKEAPEVEGLLTGWEKAVERSRQWMDSES